MERREREIDRREAVSNHGSQFLFFQECQPVKNVYLLMVQRVQETLLAVHFASLRIPFCVSVEIREQTISLISSQ